MRNFYNIHTELNKGCECWTAIHSREGEEAEIALRATGTMKKDVIPARKIDIIINIKLAMLARRQA